MGILDNADANQTRIMALATGQGAETGQAA